MTIFLPTCVILLTWSVSLLNNEKLLNNYLRSFRKISRDSATLDWICYTILWGEKLIAKGYLFRHTITNAGGIFSGTQLTSTWPNTLV